MKKAAKLLFIILLFASISLQSQTLVNALTIKSISLEQNGAKYEETVEIGQMILPNVKTKILLYQNKTLTYWAEFDYKNCGNNASLSWNTFLELNDGSIIDGNQNKMKGKLEDDKSGWIIGTNQDVFKTSDDDENTINAYFDFNMRFKN